MGFTFEVNKTYKEAGIRTRGEHITLTPHTHTQCKTPVLGAPARSAATLVTAANNGSLQSEQIFFSLLAELVAFRSLLL